MKEFFLKRYWDEEDVMYFFHLIDNIIVKQIEEWPTTIVYREEGHKKLENQTTHIPLIETEEELADYEIISEKDFYDRWKNNSIS